MKVSFLPASQQVEADRKTLLMDVMCEHGIFIDFVCGGQKTCGKCKVLVTKGNNRVFSDAEKRLLTKEEMEKGYRLACSFLIEEDTCVILDRKVFAKKKIEMQGETIPVIQKAGVVFDIGTTTVEACLVADRSSVLKPAIRTNPQRVCGLDVISRIAYAMKSDENRNRLHQLIIQCINDMLKSFMRQYQIEESQMEQIVVLGNTTMISLFLNRKAESLARGCFAGFFHGTILKGAEIGISYGRNADVLVPGMIGGHVGSDTLGCILFTRFWEQKETCLLIDVGTNGEIAVIKDGKMAACSTAAGPAFEGANIVQGMRAEEGAIYSVRREGKSFRVSTVGGERAAGICGSGLIDAAAVLLETGSLSRNGRLSDGKTALDKERKVWIWQQDIRQLQLAKSAIYSGIQILLEHVHASEDEIKKIYLAGAFGMGLNISNAVKIGLLPSVSTEVFQCIGNGSMGGGTELLKKKIAFSKCNELAAQIEHVELALSESFQNAFIKNLDFRS